MIYSIMAAYLLAFAVSVLQHKKAGQLCFGLGFLMAVAAFVYRWVNVGHVPMQNLFEVFLGLGVVILQLSWFCRRVLQVGGEAVDMLLGVVILFPAGFVFSDVPRPLMPALQCWLFGPHVAVYMISYMLMAKAAVQAAGHLLNSPAGLPQAAIDYERSTYKTICFGFSLLTLGLILGSWWGKLAWGDFWHWDPKELWSLVSWLVYVGYFHFRYMYGSKYGRVNSIWAIMGLTAIVLTLLWVNLSKIFTGLHSYAS